MGAKASTIWFVDVDDPISVLRERPAPDPAAAQALIAQLYPRANLAPLVHTALIYAADPAPNHVFVGAYPGLTVICTWQVGVNLPSTLSQQWINAEGSAHTYLVSFNSDVSWGAFASWEKGVLKRSFSAHPTKISEDLGLPQVFEGPYWAGEHPLYPEGETPQPQALPFHPGAFAVAANESWLGFNYRRPATPDENSMHAPVLSAFDIQLIGYDLAGVAAQVQRAGVDREAQLAGVRGSGGDSDESGKGRWFRRKHR